MKLSWGQRYWTENTSFDIEGFQLSELLHQIEDIIDSRYETLYTLCVVSDPRCCPSTVIHIECRDERQTATIERHLSRDDFFDDAIDLISLIAKQVVEVKLTTYKRSESKPSMTI
jgi:hypothetical protein